ncbi:helix-turn-helix domain-containing protein [Ramlibacter agri]|uniref:helix-turn-helix domain-containing protein n=1 Tax=Ramlibacter agri TaxID=2728837 RepID=UPI001F10EF42|nr:XRE family transcriptional regulator [Ramlibacter agri]
MNAPLPREAVPQRDRVGLGLRLRTERKARQLTLKELSVRSGVALSTLSKMELGQSSVGYEKVAAVAQALALDVGLLFAGPAAAPASGQALAVSGEDEGPLYRSDHYEYRMLATAFPGKRMTPLRTRIAARRRDEFSDFIGHPGQEFVMVLAGQVRIEFETGELIELKKHESAYFDSGVGHIYLSVGPRDAELVIVMA